jgi:hypothetical protein
MQFFTVTDQDGVAHKMLVVTLDQTHMNEVVGQCEKCMPSIRLSSLVQMGHAYVIVDFSDEWKTAIPLDQESEDGHRLGDELAIGDVLNVVLTSDKNAMRSSNGKVYMNVPIQSILAFSFLYTPEMAENYALFKMYNQLNAE